MANLSLIVLAAGMSSRYDGSKQVDNYGPRGEKLFDYSIYDAVQAGFDKVVLVINEEMGDEFREKIGKQLGSVCEVAYVYQTLTDLPNGFAVPSGRKKPWGTAHATMIAKKEVDSPFAVLNADDYYGASSIAAIAQRLKDIDSGKDILNLSMIGFQINNTISDFGYISRGICEVDPDGYLIEVIERTHIQKIGQTIAYTEDGNNWINLSPDTTVSMNLWGFVPAIFAEMEIAFSNFLDDRKLDLTKAEYFLPQLVNKLVKEKKASVKVIPTTETWFGVTYRDDKVKVQNALRELTAKGAYPNPLWSS